ncbi:LysR family transcriptional regulator [Rhodococcus opacus]|uniref:LysR family transcriptional regulator n=1 Tax=Rhodococcus opacus TaxID=37919 RepID=UPI0018E43F9E|nr:LysR family transcriptional regulator [Rhodococcus opacus]
MDVHQIRCFVAVAEELHFERAARRLDLTPSPVSRQVRLLERELRTDLFVREHHKVSLTDAGEAFLPPARDALRAFERLSTIPLPGIVRPDDLRFKIGATPVINGRFSQQLAQLVRQVVPDGTVELILKMSEDLVCDLSNGKLDLALILAPVNRSDIEWVDVSDCQTYAVLPSTDDLATLGSVSLSDLRQYEFVMTTSKGNPFLMNSLRQRAQSAGIRKIVELDTTDYVQAFSHLALGKRFTTYFKTDESSLPELHGDVTAIPLEDLGLKVSVGIAWNEHRCTEGDGNPHLRRIIQEIPSIG